MSKKETHESFRARRSREERQQANNEKSKSWRKRATQSLGDDDIASMAVDFAVLPEDERSTVRLIGGHQFLTSGDLRDVQMQLPESELPLDMIPKLYARLESVMGGEASDFVRRACEKRGINFDEIQELRLFDPKTYEAPRGESTGNKGHEPQGEGGKNNRGRAAEEKPAKLERAGAVAGTMAAGALIAGSFMGAGETNNPQRTPQQQQTATNLVAAGHQQRRQSSRAGLTVTELLVCIAITAVLVALLLPAVQAAREAARRTQQKNTLHNVALAAQSHVATFQKYPAGSRNKNGVEVSGVVDLLPYMELGALYEKYDQSKPWDMQTQEVKSAHLGVYNSPVGRPGVPGFALIACAHPEYFPVSDGNFNNPGFFPLGMKYNNNHLSATPVPHYVGSEAAFPLSSDGGAQDPGHFARGTSNTIIAVTNEGDPQVWGGGGHIPIVKSMAWCDVTGLIRALAMAQSACRNMVPRRLLKPAITLFLAWLRPAHIPRRYISHSVMAAFVRMT